MSKSITSIKEELKAVHSFDDERLYLYREDQRKGVQSAILQTEKRLAKEREMKEKFQEMLAFENAAYKNRYQFIAGIDEVGRGPLAGPVIAAAVILPKDVELLGVNDSKQLSAVKRELLFDEIQNKAVSIGIGLVSHEVIDEVNIYEATKIAMKQAVESLTPRPDFLLIDAMKLDLDIPQENLIKGDTRSISIAAASIIAKVTRDRLMEYYAKDYPGYGFEKNAGYGTKEHLEGIATLGITPIHRKTFAPIKDLI
ncbi:MAG: ribonuclease HII [Lactobacillales bacterium]|jgi:ribonuclease HII|nr:ribonuclease HII [Lactobacillales bacterium]